MARIVWSEGEGPATTQELANVVEAEGHLCTGWFVRSSDRVRCLWGVIEDYHGYNSEGSRKLSLESTEQLIDAQLGSCDNDDFEGTMKERCVEMVMRLRAIP